MKGVHIAPTQLMGTAYVVKGVQVLNILPYQDNYFRLQVSLYVHSYILPSVQPSVHTSICQSVHLSIHGTLVYHQIDRSRGLVKVMLGIAKASYIHSQF